MFSKTAIVEPEAPLIEVKDLTVSYPNGYQALTKVNLVVDQLATLGLVGPSGCGKSTLVKTLLGLLPKGSKISGSVKVVGIDILTADAEQIRKARGLIVGYIAQDPFAACDPMRRVGHHIEAAWKMHQLPVPANAALDQLNSVGIENAAQRVTDRPFAFSGGMLQRASIAAGTVHQPQLVLADEPTSALDAELAGDVLDLIDRRSTGLLLVTHDLALVTGHCEQVVVMSAGEIVERGLTSQVLADPKTAAAKKLVAASPKLSGKKTQQRARGQLVIEASKLNHSYATQVLSNQDLAVYAGQIIGIQGPSGCGKSTLLRMIGGLEQPDEGTIRFVDRQGVKHRNRPRGFVMPVFQNPVGSLSQRWPIWRCLAEPLRAAGQRKSKTEWLDWARQQLDAIGLAETLALRKPRQLSVGQAQRVAILRALVADPAVILADEPSASLDVVSAKLIYQMLSKAADNGTGVVIVSHDTTRLATVADRIIYHHNGCFIES
ncbi:MAG: ABC transporter ATP-binding protein [Chloroflexi bacterium]|nr:MAG: ABC transporter ATP-binding protein [Chloroflexota bacterium]